MGISLPDSVQIVAPVLGLRNAMEQILGGLSMPNRSLLKTLISLATCSGVYAVVSAQHSGNYSSKCCDHWLSRIEVQSKVKETSCA